MSPSSKAYSVRALTDASRGSHPVKSKAWSLPGWQEDSVSALGAWEGRIQQANILPPSQSLAWAACLFLLLFEIQFHIVSQNGPELSG